MHAPPKIAVHSQNARIAPADSRGENSYDFVRFCAASAVLFSHHFDLTGLPEPRVPGYGGDFGELGVEIFFCLSGFLICQSLRKSADWAHFFSARILRIFPNLTFVLVMTSAATLFWYGNYAHLWPHAEYVIRNLLLMLNGVTDLIPGVFADAVQPAVNDPLWTLPYELWLYVVLFLIFAFSGKRTRICIVLGVLLVGISWSAMSMISEAGADRSPYFDVFRLSAYFLCGAALATFWPHLKTHAMAIGFAGLVGIFITREFMPFDTILVSLSLAAATIGLGSSKAMAWFSKGGDASYGMYVFAWPVQQFCLLLIGSFWLSLPAAFLVTAALGYATWHGFEKRAMSYRGKLAAWMRREPAKSR